MIDDKVMQLLYEETEAERKQRSSSKFYEDMPEGVVETGSRPGRIGSKSGVETKRILNNFFFQNRSIRISKHTRFAPYPAHTHTFLEMNYMLKGTVDEIVNGTPITLQQGDLLIMDRGTVHSLGYTGEDDLLINILFRDDLLNIDFLKGLRKSRNVLYQFLLRGATGRDDGRGSDYLLFRTAANPEITATVDHMINEYYLNEEFSDSILEAELQILIVQLVRGFQVETEGETSSSRRLVLQMLSEITEEYRTVSLQELAGRHGYSRNYLGNLFKKEVGRTFSETLNRQRMMKAHSLILSTKLPVDEIMEDVGITNKNFFYSKYREYYGDTPGSERKSEHQNEIAAVRNLQDAL